ncbi:amidohydrolase family protein [Paenibacillus sediminis]|uniref:Aminocarboxymuconate-semialdehyde decarboxylase n=1 Tax=Paenibacillus sediminis TaxID=664909 RepID=A0ABS4GYB2_9BACL|nr:amidohydrolase family protein [Paenibacillus sediminis]MBP1935246.1 aminocarboxymuconate-semialdehyde decarboxylase [Paenibacillus sediminis]
MYDAHTHVVTHDVMEWLRANQNKVHAKWIKRDPAKAEFLNVNGSWEFELKEAFVNSELYLKEQEKAGVIHSLISPIPQLFLYEFESDITSELASVYNDSLVELVQANRTKLSALATLPLNEPERAAMELNRVMGKGLKGAIIASSWSGNRLSDDKFIPFWEEADRQKAVLFIHPLLNMDPRLSHKMMANLIGVPWETTVCAVDLIVHGILDKFPNVKILLAHGGGFLPYQIGRIHKGYENWKAVSSSMQSSPFDYLTRFWYDTVLWNSSALQYLIELVGKERVVPGSDYPFDLCEWPPELHDSGAFIKLMEG